MTLSENFRAIARSVTSPAMMDIQIGACPDQLVGPIARFNYRVDTFPIREPANQRNGNPLVILLMESPHTEEFLGDWGPAKGKTGSHIRRYTQSIVGRLSGPMSDLILVNAIQYQCSLGKPTNRYRDEVFSRLWGHGGREDFSGRLVEIFRPGDMLLNCCTVSDGRRQLVSLAIRDSLKLVPIYAGPHPFSWFSEPCRRSIRLVAV